jgi:hypothetical protein
MTIAAGFCCSDGVVLCADTQFTIPGGSKYPESKLRVLPDIKCLPYFAFCGDMDYQKQCITHFGAAIDGAERAGKTVLASLEVEALALHTTYYDVYSEPDEKLNAAMFVSVLNAGKRELYKIWGPKVSKVDVMDAMGTGRDVARALADSYWVPNNTMYRTALAATFILTDVKKYVDGCGGDSQIACLGHDGSWKYFSQDDFPKTLPIAAIERHYQYWKRHFGYWLLNSQDFRESQDKFKNGVTALFEQFIKERAARVLKFEETEAKGRE